MFNSKEGMLSSEEKERLQECETVLHRGLSTFFEVGSALLTIREGRLYRVGHPTFEAYCHERWGIGRSYAWRVMGAAERLKLLPSAGKVARPTNEFQMRPFLKLQPEAFPKAWEQVIARAKNGRITSGLIRDLVEELEPQEKGEVKTESRTKTFRFSKRCKPGQIVALLHETKRRIEKGETRESIATLQTIENLLFGSNPK